MPPTYLKVIGKVRKRSLLGPHQRGFDAEKWADAFSSKQGEEAHLRDAGLILHDVLTELRAKSQLLLSLPAKQKWGLAGLVAWANLSSADLLHKMHRHQSVGDRTYFDASDITSVRETLDSGQLESFDESVTALVDSFVYPLQHFLHADITNENIEQGVDWNWTAIIKNANQYSLAYSFCQKTIYQRMSLICHAEQSVLSAVDEREARLLAMSDFYGQERQTERALVFSIASEKHLSGRTRIAPLPRRYVSKIFAREHYYSVKTLSRRSSNHFEIPHSMKVAFATTSPATVSLLDRQVDGIAPGTLRLLVGAWTLIGEVASNWALMHSKAVVQRNDALGSALIMPNKGLVSLFSEGLPCAREVAQRIFEFLRFSGKSHDDLWIRPIVPLDDEFSAIFVASLTIPNMGRVIDSWIESCQPLAVMRGNFFENIVRDQVQLSFKEQHFARGAVVAESRFDLPNQQGDVDILAFVDGVLIVGELKCQKHPADPAERHYYCSTLRKAINQVTKAARALRENPNLVSQKLGLQDTSKIASLPVLRVVLTNQYYCAGIAFSGVPVLQYEYFVENLSDRKFLESLMVFAGTPPSTLPYLGDFDEVASDDLCMLPLSGYQDIMSRMYPATKSYSLLKDTPDFEEKYFWIRSTYAAGSFFNTPGVVVRP